MPKKISWPHARMRQPMRIALWTMLVLSLVSEYTQAGLSPDKAESEVRATIQNANQAIVRAVRTNNTKHLTPYLSGEVLRRQSHSIGEARSRGSYTVSELQDLRWRALRVRGTKAEAETTERWKHTLYSSDHNKCLFVVPARNIAQTYHLEKSSRGWTIKNVTYDPRNEKPKAAPCQ